MKKQWGTLCLSFLLLAAFLAGCGVSPRHLAADIQIKASESDHPAKILFFFSKSQKVYQELLNLTVGQLNEKHTASPTRTAPAGNEEKEILPFSVSVTPPESQIPIEYSYDPDTQDLVAVIYTFSFREKQQVRFDFSMDPGYKWGLLCAYPHGEEFEEVPEDVRAIDLVYDYEAGMKSNFVKEE